MKKLLLVVILLLVPSLSWAPPPEYCLSSGALSSTQAVTTTPAKLCGVIIETVAADVTATVSDGSGGKQLFKMTVVAADRRGGAVFPKPIASMSSLYLTLSGAGGVATVYYEP